MFALFKIIGAAVAIYEVADSLTEPVAKAINREIRSKEDAALFLVKVLTYEAENGKMKDIVRKVPLKPDDQTTGYFQIKSGNEINFVVVYKNGDVAIKFAEKKEWEWYKSPKELNRLYDYFRTNFNKSVKGVAEARLQIADFGTAAKSAIKAPSAVEKLKQ